MAARKLDRAAAGVLFDAGGGGDGHGRVVRVARIIVRVCELIMWRKSVAIFFLLLFVACIAQTPNPFALADTKWELVSITENGATKTPVPGATVTLNFARDNKVSGNAGCNSYNGAYEAQGEILKIGTLAVTAMACLENDKMEMEAAFLTALQDAQLFEKRGNELTLTFANGKGKLNSTKGQ